MACIWFRTNSETNDGEIPIKIEINIHETGPEPANSDGRSRRRWRHLRVPQFEQNAVVVLARSRSVLRHGHYVRGDEWWMIVRLCRASTASTFPAG